MERMDPKEYTATLIAIMAAIICGAFGLASLLPERTIDDYAYSTASDERYDPLPTIMPTPPIIVPTPQPAPVIMTNGDGNTTSYEIHIHYTAQCAAFVGCWER